MRLGRPLIPRRQPKKPAKAPRPSSGQLETGPAVVDTAASSRRSCAPDVSERGGLFAHQCCTRLASLTWCISQHSTSAMMNVSERRCGREACHMTQYPNDAMRRLWRFYKPKSRTPVAKTQPVIEIERHAWFHAGHVADSSPSMPNHDPRGPCRFQIRFFVLSRR